MVIQITERSKISLIDEENPRFTIKVEDLEEKIILRAPSMENAMNWILNLRSCCYNHPNININSFDIMETIGKGFYGKVLLVRKKDTKELFAIKTVHKKRLVQSGKVHTIISERNILSQVSHPFVITLFYAFQSLSKFYLVLEYIAGGDLFFRMDKTVYLPLEEIRLYTAEITLALNYIHSLGIIYRDLKPENILLDSEGHVKLTDFGLSKIIGQNEFTLTFCGTNEYLAPEIIKREEYNQSVDWWALGVLIYEMIYLTTPFFHENSSKMYMKIINEELSFPYPTEKNTENLLKGLLVKKPSNRFNYDDIVKHPFFNGLDFQKVYNRGYKPKYIPKISTPESVENFHPEFTEESPYDSIGSPVLGSASQISGFSYTNTTLIIENDNNVSILASPPN